MQFWTLDEMPEEIAPGVRIERRAVLRFGAQLAGLAAIGGLAGCAPESAGSATGRHSGVAPPAAGPTAPTAAEPAPLRVGEFVREIRPRARDLIHNTDPDEEAYLRAAGDLLAKLETVEPWRKPRPGAPYAMDATAVVPPIVLYRIHMEPGAVIPIHDHRHYNGVILCTEGSLRCRNFNIVPDADQPLDLDAGQVPLKGTEFVIRETIDQTIGPGERSSLTRARDNIHEVTAGDQGCVLMDLFTHFRPDARSYAIRWDDTPFDPAQRLYRVAWA